MVSVVGGKASLVKKLEEAKNRLHKKFTELLFISGVCQTFWTYRAIYFNFIAKLDREYDYTKVFGVAFRYGYAAIVYLYRTN